MTIKRSVCYTKTIDSFQAGVEAANSIISDLNNEIPQCFLLFNTIGHNTNELVKGIKSISPSSIVCGCSSSGNITHLGSDEAITSLCAVGFSLTDGTIEPFYLENIASNPKLSAAELANEINGKRKSSDKNSLLLLFTVGLNFHVELFMTSFEKELKEHIDIVGGLSANDYLTPSTFQFLNEEVTTSGAVALLLRGKFHHHIEVSHGGISVGNHWVITKSTDNKIFELDNRPVLDVLREYFGEEVISDMANTINQIGLAVPFMNKNYSKDIIIRAILGLNKNEGSITLGVSLPTGTKIKLTRRDKDAVLEGTKQCASKLLDKIYKPDEALFLYVNCTGRGSYLFGETATDPNMLVKTLKARPVIGFFSFGEIAPVEGSNEFHNYTGVLLGIE